MGAHDFVNDHIHTSHPNRKLGWLPSDPEKPRLMLTSFFDATALTVPATVDFLSLITDWDMALNDQLGCCTASAMDHLFRVWSRYGQGVEAQFIMDDILTFYEGSTGYNPADPSTDQGGVMTDVLDYAHKVGMAGHTIDAYAKLDPQDVVTAKAALYAFGGLYIGLMFPDSAMHQFDVGQPWDVVRHARDEGGHCVHGGKIRDDGLWEVITWGRKQLVTPAFIEKYFIEVEAPISREWVLNGKTGGGLDIAACNTEYTKLTGRPGPFADVPAPTPVPTPAPAPIPAPAPVPTPAPAPHDPPGATALLNGILATLQAQEKMITDFLGGKSTWPVS